MAKRTKSRSNVLTGAQKSNAVNALLRKQGKRATSTNVKKATLSIEKAFKERKARALAKKRK